MTARTRGVVVALAIATISAFLVWNGIFGLHVSRGEKQYLIEEARFRLGERPAPSLPAIMADTVRAGARQATEWAVVVFVLSVAASYAGARLTRR